MSRGDEIQPGEPQRPGWASGDYEEEPDQVERLHVNKPQRSGAVTAAGIIAIVWGVWTILGSACVALMPLALPAMTNFVAKANPNDPNAAKLKEMVDRIPMWYLAVGAVVQFLLGVGYIVGGIGTVKRSNAARLVTVALAVLGVVIFVANTAFNVSMGLVDAGGVFGAACGGVFAVGFAVLMCVLLLTPRSAAEFRT